MEDKGSKIEFIRSLEWPKRGIDWIGDEGFIRLSGGMTAVIALTIRACDGLPTAGAWNGLHVRVRRSDTGEVDAKYFPWNDHLKPAAKQEHPNARIQNHLMVIDHCGWRWYILQPESTKPIVDAVMRWLRTFEP